MTHFNVSENRLTSLRGIPRRLEKLQATGNSITELESITTPLQNCKQLRTLNLSDLTKSCTNPVCTLKNYRQALFALLGNHSLQTLDWTRQNESLDIDASTISGQLSSANLKQPPPLAISAATSSCKAQNLMEGSALHDASKDLDGRICEIEDAFESIRDECARAKKFFDDKNAENKEQLTNIQNSDPKHVSPDDKENLP